MSTPIVYIDRSTIRPGRAADVRHMIEETVRFLDAREPQLLHYGFYVDEDGSRMTVVAVHPDAASVERHMDVGGPMFRRFGELIDLERIEVYGEPSERMLEQLHDKVRALGSGDRVVVDRLHAGFSRVGRHPN